MIMLGGFLNSVEAGVPAHRLHPLGRRQIPTRSVSEFARGVLSLLSLAREFGTSQQTVPHTRDAIPASWGVKVWQVLRMRSLR